MSRETRFLADIIRQEMKDLDRAVDRTQVVYDLAVRLGLLDYLDGVALNLHGFYAGIERIFERIARSVDESVPDGSHWHQALLVQMARPISEVRPSVISEQTRNCLDVYRGFRHLVRNIYTFNLVPSKIGELVKGLPACHQQLVTDLEVFCEFLALSEEEA